MMNKLNPGTRVGVLENGEIRKGNIKNAYYDCNIAIVVFDDGNVEKVPFSKLGLLAEEKVPYNREPIEKSEITITPQEFRKITSEVIKNETEEMGSAKGVLRVAFTIIIAKIHRALFYDEGNND